MNQLKNWVNALLYLNRFKDRFKDRFETGAFDLRIANICRLIVMVTHLAMPEIFSYGHDNDGGRLLSLVSKRDCC